MLKYWPPLNALRGFEAAARLGSFHQAAAQLHVTQSAISQQIRSLESQLEQPLFIRQGRSVTLTDAGQDFYTSVQDTLKQLAIGVRRLDQYRKSNQLIVNTTPAFARHWLLPRLGQFQQRHPDIDIWLFTTYDVPNMEMETIDIAIRDDLAIQNECTFEVLYQDSLYPACHPSLLGAKSPLTLHGEREMDWSNWVIGGGESVGQSQKGVNFSDPSLLLDAVSQGLGIGLVSQLLATQALNSGQLIPLTEQRVTGAKWAWLIHKDAERNPLTQYFRQWLTAEMATCSAQSE
ncbi:LysR family transcriptional regulator [Providencia alcalifaciens]|uniref:LysR family transcriptional regulator n=1 Tax=Providencia alcalifaciens TaxID=126385 RepID=A0A4R3NPF6_9GAMM|nr:LysR substrate-binding domain-containing protein [Providencia alcalifaciens]TCT34552.1 LysR family transcriptional regulator [Providencia alcalifaciens]